MQEILRAPAPYGMIKEAESLIQTVEGINDALVTQHREQALRDIEQQLAKVQLELDAAKASNDLRNQCLQPLQSLKRQVEAQSSIAHIDQARVTAVDAADDAFQKIEAASTATVTPGVGDDDPPKPYVKPRRIVKAAGLAPKGLLETQGRHRRLPDHASPDARKGHRRG